MIWCVSVSRRAGSRRGGVEDRIKGDGLIHVARWVTRGDGWDSFGKKDEAAQGDDRVKKADDAWFRRLQIGERIEQVERRGAGRK